MTTHNILWSICVSVLFAVLIWCLRVEPSGKREPGQRSLGEWIWHEGELAYYEQLRRWQSDLKKSP